MCRYAYSLSPYQIPYASEPRPKYRFHAAAICYFTFEQKEINDSCELFIPANKENNLNNVRYEASRHFKKNGGNV
jgi:hypothetical protein